MRNNALRFLLLTTVEGRFRGFSCAPRIASSLLTGTSALTSKLKCEKRFRTPVRSLSSFISMTARSVQVTEEDAGLLIRQEEWPEAVFLPFVWLRDHCRCDQCFSHVTLQRQAVIDPSWLTLRPDDVTADDTTLSLTWPDGHHTLFSLPWLWANSYEGQRHLPRPETTMRHLWNASQLGKQGGVPRVSYGRFMDQEEGVAQLIRHLVSVGVCIVDQAPVTVDDTIETAKRLCAIQNTFWGPIHVLEQNPEGNDLAFSNKALPPHVDGNYLLEGPGLQVFHALEASPIGGETLLVDSFAAACRLPADMYALLSSTPLVFEYRDKGGKVYQSTNTIFKHHPITGELMQFRFCPNDLGPLSSIKPSAILSFYEAYSRLLQEVQQDEAVFVHRLTPGEVLFVDNWRVMHGRRKFSGRRVLAGCYLGRADYMCRARTLKVID